MHSGFDLSQLLQQAQTRWLKPPEVFFILQNHDKYQINQQPPQKPPSGSLFLFNRRVLRFFRKDGHSWRKKKDGRNLGEAHERLKVGNAEALNCYYAHGEENPNFQRRSFWMLDPAYEHIVLVQYREVTEGRSSSGSSVELSPGSSCAFSQCPSVHDFPNTNSTPFTDFHDSYQAHSSPGSTEVSSDAVMGKRVDYFQSVEGESLKMSMSTGVAQALRRLELQLSLDDENLKDYTAIDTQVENKDDYRLLDDLSYNTYAEVSYDCQSLSSKRVSDFELGTSGAMNLHVTSSPRTYTAELSTTFINSNLGLLEHSSLTVAKEQRFTIRDTSPEWGFCSDYTKVIIVGSFLCDQADYLWHCMFDDIEVPLQIIQDGVLCCKAPPHPSGKVALCITTGNRDYCSEIREFEYRDKHRTDVRIDEHEGKITRSTEELLLLVRFVQTLLSNHSTRQGENSRVEADLIRKQQDGDYSWGQIIEALLVGGGTTFGTLDWLLRQLLKDKLLQWLSSKPLKSNGVECSLSKREQGIIHMIAGLGYEWALNPILGCQVGINFRDINGWTALHWAAKFGREKMVAALIASGASPVAVSDPSSYDPIGRMPAYVAAANGHRGIAAYLSELALTSHLSSLKLEEYELSKCYAEVEAEFAVNSIPKASLNSTDDQLSLRHTLGAVRNAAQAAARIQAAFRAHSFRKRQNTEAVAAAAYGVDEYGFTPSDILGLSAASKLAFRSFHDHNKAALSIQKNYRSWKGRKDFLTLRQKVVKIQAHVRGYQVRKKHICWAVGILDKVVLRWRRKGAGLRGYKAESDFIGEEEKDDEDIVKVFRKERVNAAINEAVSTVVSMVDSPEARQQYNRMLGKYQQAKAELECLTSEGAATFSNNIDAVSDDILRFS